MLLLLGSLPARADFKYTESSKITGGSLKNMMKFAGVFNKDASQAMKPVSSTHYVKGNAMRTDESDGWIEIFDLDRKLVIRIDPQNKTYSQATFDEIRDAMNRAAENAKQKMQSDPKTRDAKMDVKAKVNVTPGATGRMVNGYSANEMKMDVEMEFTAQQQPNDQPSAQPNSPASGTMTTHVDSWVAPDVTGYSDFAEFYKKMAKEINWTPPSGIAVSPQVSQSMQELRKNQDLYKGFPILQYLSMSMASAQGAAGSQNSQTSPSASSGSSNTSSSPSEALAKGLGGLFGKKKKKDDASSDSSASSSASNPPPPPSVPGSLIEMTIEATAFSNATLDPSLFAVPAGYTRLPNDPNNMFGRPSAKK